MSPRVLIPAIIILAVLAGFFIWPNSPLPILKSKEFKLGLDLKGGTHLVYRADVSQILPAERDEAMNGLKDVIERRVNLFGVTEPIINVNKVGGDHRLIVELAGIKSVTEAIELIGETPFLEFREEIPQDQRDSVVSQIEQQGHTINPDTLFVPTPLTGRFLNRAQLSFSHQTNDPTVLLEFNNEGQELFAELSGRNIGKQLAIYLDGVVLSAPVVQQEITGGTAQITGNFSVKEARELVRNLNSGALPVPIELISQQTVGATLGAESLQKSLFAGFIGFLLIALFMLFYYRLAGFISVVTLMVYIIIVLTLFKLIPVTLTLAGIVGFILSVGMAVDANILIFERMKEELRGGRSFRAAYDEGFRRAWVAIRDAYTSTLMTSVVLYWFGTSLVRGFALTLAIGLLVSLILAIILTKTFLQAFASTRLKDVKFLWRQ